jgi:glycerol-3-phosphate dehydrogenase subunit B
MNFDVVIIGGGLAGLTCGIALQEQGKRCVIINNGQAAIDFASGSLDLLSRLPNGAFVKNIPENLTALAAQLPQHPYSIMGAERVLAKAQNFEKLAESLNCAIFFARSGNWFTLNGKPQHFSFSNNTTPISIALNT